MCVLCGCSYPSQYVPIPDGRARVVWRDTDVAIDLTRPDASPECLTLVRAGGLTLKAPDGYWVPRYYGPQLVVVEHGVPPLLPRPVLFSPSLELAKVIAGPQRWSMWAGTGAHIAPPPVSGGGGGVHISGGGDSGKALVILAVIALVVLPTLDLALAIHRPESDGVAAQVTDQVNKYNDLARLPGTDCSYPEAP